MHTSNTEQNKSELREHLRQIVTRNGKTGRIPELLEDELDKLQELIESHVAQQVKEARIDAVRKFIGYTKSKDKLFIGELEAEMKRLQSTPKSVKDNT